MQNKILPPQLNKHQVIHSKSFISSLCNTSVLLPLVIIIFVLNMFKPFIHCQQTARCVQNKILTLQLNKHQVKKFKSFILWLCNISVLLSFVIIFFVLDMFKPFIHCQQIPRPQPTHHMSPHLHSLIGTRVKRQIAVGYFPVCGTMSFIFNANTLSCISIPTDWSVSVPPVSAIAQQRISTRAAVTTALTGSLLPRFTARNSNIPRYTRTSLLDTTPLIVTQVHQSRDVALTRCTMLKLAFDACFIAEIACSTTSLILPRRHRLETNQLRAMTTMISRTYRTRTRFNLLPHRLWKMTSKIFPMMIPFLQSSLSHFQQNEMCASLKRLLNWNQDVCAAIPRNHQEFCAATLIA